MGSKHLLGLLVLFTLLFIPFTLATGLQVTPEAIEINKTQSIDYSFDLTFNNQESFDMWNIQPEDDIIEMGLIQRLAPGSSVTIKANITQDNEFDGKVNFIQFRNATLGSLNETYIVDVNFIEGLSQCDLTLVKGDSIKWINKVSDDIVLRNYDTGNDVTTIGEGENYTMKFNSPQVFQYYFLRWGVPFGGVCKITIFGDSGIINDPQYDDEINLKVNINFKPTQLNATFLTDSYTMNFNGQVEDIFSIRNVGNETAKGVKITSNWIIASPNNFDLSPGESKNIAYIIKPIIFSTEETNKTYNEIITIKGNFPTIEKNLSIFINYKLISSDYANTTINDEIIGYLIEKYCEDHPEEEVCQRNIIKIVNGSERTLTYNTTEGDWNKIWSFQFEESENSREFENWVKDYMYENNLTMSMITSNQTGVYEAIDKISQRIENQNSISIFFALFFAFLFALGILIFLITNEWSQNKLKGLFSKGESKW